MAQHRHRTFRHHGERLHMHGEAVDLHAVDLATSKGPAQRVDADVLRFEVAGGLVDLAVKARYLDLAALAGSGAQRRVLPEQAENMQTAADQLLERHPVVFGDGGEPDMKFFLVVFGADVKRGTWCR